MKPALLLFATLALSACGLDPLSVAQRLTDDSERQRPYADCQQTLNLVSYIENHSSQAVNFTLYYEDYYDYPYGHAENVTVNIPAGGTFGQTVGTASETHYSSDTSDGSCTTAAEKRYVDLKGTMSTVSMCRVKTGVAYLIDSTATCPDYTTPGSN